MGNLGVTEIIIAALVIFLLFGVKRLPEMAKGLGQGMKEFKKAIKDNQEDDKNSESEKK